jgi:hypothetical protein
MDGEDQPAAHSALSPKAVTISFPVSAVEWNASASMAELPVKKAAKYLKIAIVRLETMAT